MRAFILTALATMTIAAPAYAGPVHVFGPGGPAPAMKKAAATFSKLRGVKVEVVAGPTSDLIDAAKQSGDVIYSGSETMMTDLQLAMGDRIDPTTITPPYLRVSNILVRPRIPHKGWSAATTTQLPTLAGFFCPPKVCRWVISQKRQSRFPSLGENSRLEAV